MMLDRILLFEQSSEALEAVKNGNAIVSSGGIRRKGDGGKGFLDLAKPVSMTVADFQALFEGKDHAVEMDSRLCELEHRFGLSDNAQKDLENIGWLNNAAIEKTYSVTYEGFQRTLQGIENVTNQLAEMEKIYHEQHLRDLKQTNQTYINYMRTDAGLLCSPKYNVTNGSIAAHLDQISAFIKRLLDEVKNSQDSFIAIQLLINILSPFAYVVRKYTALYYFENDKTLMPGNYEEWVNTIAAVCENTMFRNKVGYYISLKTQASFRDKMTLKRIVIRNITDRLSEIHFERNYIKSHDKEEYLAIDEQIRTKIEKNDFYIVDNNVVLFLDNNKQGRC